MMAKLTRVKIHVPVNHPAAYTNASVRPMDDQPAELTVSTAEEGYPVGSDVTAATMIWLRPGFDRSRHSSEKVPTRAGSSGCSVDSGARQPKCNDWSVDNVRVPLDRGT